MNANNLKKKKKVSQQRFFTFPLNKNQALVRFILGSKSRADQGGAFNKEPLFPICGVKGAQSCEFHVSSSLKH